MPPNADLDRALLALQARAKTIKQAGVVDVLVQSRLLLIGLDLDLDLDDLNERAMLVAGRVVDQIADGADPVRWIAGQWQIGLVTGLLLAEQRQRESAQAEALPRRGRKEQGPPSGGPGMPAVHQSLAASRPPRRRALRLPRWIGGRRA